MEEKQKAADLASNRGEKDNERAWKRDIRTKLTSIEWETKKAKPPICNNLRVWWHAHSHYTNALVLSLQSPVLVKCRSLNARAKPREAKFFYSNRLLLWMCKYLCNDFFLYVNVLFLFVFYINFLLY